MKDWTLTLVWFEPVLMTKFEQRRMLTIGIIRLHFCWHFWRFQRWLNFDKFELILSSFSLKKKKKTLIDPYKWAFVGRARATGRDQAQVQGLREVDQSFLLRPFPSGMDAWWYAHDDSRRVRGHDLCLARARPAHASADLAAAGEQRSRAGEHADARVMDTAKSLNKNSSRSTSSASLPSRGRLAGAGAGRWRLRTESPVEAVDCGVRESVSVETC